MNDVSEGSMRFAQITHLVPAVGLAATLGAAGVIAVVAGVRAQSETAVTVANFAFSPKEASVPAGSAVTWTNRDRASHTITSNDNAWDSASPLTELSTSDSIGDNYSDIREDI
jgi:plastocyanin